MPYRSSYDQEFKNETNFTKQWIVWLALFFAVVGVASWALTRGEQAAESAILHYEEFEEIHATCDQLNRDLGTIRETPDADPMFASFSKAAMVAAKRQQLSRWVGEYNAKSRMWNRALWKSSSLPYQLSTDDFDQYEGGMTQ